MFLTILLTLHAALFAAEVRLFESRGVPVSDYNERLAGLQPGDELAFSNGRRFVFEGSLGQGNTTYVIAVDGGSRALRLPISPQLDRVSMAELVNGEFTSRFPAHEYLSSFVHGYRILSGANVPVVATFAAESDTYEYLLVEKLGLAFTLEELITGSVADRDAAAEARQQLVEFARKTWLFAEIGDFRANQLGWVKGRGWVLFDFTETMIPYWAAKAPLATTFDRVNSTWWPQREHLNAAILEQRATMDARYCEYLLGGANSGLSPETLHALRRAHSKK